MTVLPDTQKLPKFEPENMVSSALFTPDMVAADSHPGLVRTENEDSYAYAVSDDGNMLFLMVADGIGGNESGDLASRYTVELMLRDFQLFQKKGTPSAEQALEFLKERFTLINSSLRNFNLNYNIPHPMGTTVAVLLLLPDAALTAHAGDSRVYRLRDGAMRALTRDHSVVCDLIEKGELLPGDAENHPMAHVISRSMGIKSDLCAEYHLFDRRADDRYLVCSDGLMLHLSDESIRNVLAAAKTPRDAIRNLVCLTLRGGGGDNTTVVCVFS